MRAIDPVLGRAFALSLLLHALLLAAVDLLTSRSAAPLGRTGRESTSRCARADVWEPLPLAPLFDEWPQPAPRSPARQPPVRAGRAANAARAALARESGAALEGEAARQAGAQMSRELLYPPEAIARGLEGQALVLLVLDAAGDAVAARLEASSGHALLDDAAVRAARTLRALPDSAPRETLLPVRFRLR